MNVAKTVRLEKARHPENFCAARGCLWRIRTTRGPSPCPKHPVPVATTAVEDAAR